MYRSRQQQLSALYKIMNNEKLRDSNELRSGNMMSQFFFSLSRDELEDPDANDAAPVLLDGR